jgi:hypothetical protein
VSNNETKEMHSKFRLAYIKFKNKALIILNIQKLSKRCSFLIIPTPHAASNSSNLKSSEAVAPKNERATSNWAVVLIWKTGTA